ncbi:uncharacterized protein LOC123205447 [Mangifera indica]|uniref:uncharacterized protein LOC123193830 n=1 Tax=Mangifera indica TaxID=29780 RepID=UPI001CFA34AB|nr:uncharacterized protein LOC123193830 [Mangifera indica]XP_044478332.1 uncharacterized protein LOC123205447 [Mangifera indica]
MDDRKEKNGPCLSVPQFGDWDQKGELPDYSMDFSKIREMRKQNKRDVSRASLGNEEDFINPSATATTTTTITATTTQNGHHDQHQPHYYHQSRHHSPTTRRGIFSYFNCCVKA